MMTFGSLFSGIGGMDLGLERAGLVCRWQVEKDEYCRRVLARHWPDVPKFDDVRAVGAANLEPVDCIAGGPPCQPVSTQGHKRASADERWLWDEYFRVVGELRPRFALMENVAGLLFWGMGDVLGNLAGIGYDAEWTTVCPSPLGGPQYRERVFVLAYPHDGRLEGIHQEPRVFPTAEGTDWRGVVAGKAGADGRRDAERFLWPPEPDVVRVADGIPDRVDRLVGLGNAVSPPIAEWIGRRLMEAVA